MLANLVKNKKNDLFRHVNNTDDNDKCHNSDPRIEFQREKQRMINNFVSMAKNTAPEPAYSEENDRRHQNFKE